MNNNFYFIKTRKICLFVFAMVFLGLCSTVQAQFTHRWNAATGDWNVASNWQGFTTSANYAALVGATTTVVSFTGDLTTATFPVAAGDYVQSGTTGNNFTVTGTFVYGNFVDVISYNGVNNTTTVTLKYPMTAPGTGTTFSFLRATATGAVPNAASSVVLIESGVCTLSDTKLARVVVVGNTGTTAGRLDITSTGVLSITSPNSNGTSVNPNLSIRGGVVENNGEIRSTATAGDGSALIFSNALVPIASGTWGLIGTGKLILGNSGAELGVRTGLIKIDQTTSIAPEIFINANSTASLANPVVFNAGNHHYSMINMGINAKARIRGVGFTGPATSPIICAPDGGYTLTIDAGVTLTSTLAASCSPIVGSIVNNGILENDGVIPVTNATGTITGTGVVVLKSKQLNGYILTLPAGRAAIAIGDTYTNDGVTYTVANYGRAVNAVAAIRLLVTANSTKGLAQTAVLTKVTGTGDATIACTAVARCGTGYLTFDNDNAKTINVKQEYYVRSNQRGWRLLANPLDAVTYGTVATGSTTPITLGADAAYTYNSTTNVWASANTDDTQTWARRAASLLFVRGRASEVSGSTYSVNPPSNVTLAVTGVLTNNQATRIGTTAGRWYVYANPYTAPLSYHLIKAQTTPTSSVSDGLSNTIAYYDPTLQSNGTTDLTLKKGGYRTIETGTGAAGAANDIIIPPMGAIFVYASSVGNIAYPRAAIHTGNALNTASFNLKTAETAVTQGDLRFDITSTDTFYDAVALRFKSVGAVGTNINFGKLTNEILTAYSLAGTSKMAVSELELKDQVIPLGITTSLENTYNLQVKTNTVPDTYVATLVDNFLNTRTELTSATIYPFTVSSDPASQGEGRFSIDIQAKSLSLDNNEVAENVQFWPNPASNQVNIRNSNTADDTTVEISSIDGKNVYSQVSKAGSTTVVPTSNWAKGIYIIKMTSNESKVSKKLIIQ